MLLLYRWRKFTRGWSQAPYDSAYCLYQHQRVGSIPLISKHTSIFQLSQTASIKSVSLRYSVVDAKVLSIHIPAMLLSPPARQNDLECQHLDEWRAGLLNLVH